MTDSLLAKKAELEQRRDELQQRLNKIQADYRNGLSKDSEEQAVELENAEVLAEISRVSQEELQKVNVALERIEQELSHTSQ